MAEFLEGDTIKLELPLKREYLPVLRSTVGVVAGSLSFNYDEIVQLRIAASEVFDTAVRVAQEGAGSLGDTLNIRLVRREAALDLHFEPAIGYRLDEESRALLQSLLDEVEFEPRLRMYKERKHD